GQPAQPSHIHLVDPAQVHQHVRLDPPVHSAVVRQGHVPHHTAVDVGPRREPQKHDYDPTTVALPIQGQSPSVVLLHSPPTRPAPGPCKGQSSKHTEPL